MKIDIDEVKNPTAEEIYQVGNVIESDGDLYLVIKAGEKYALLDLADNRVIYEYKTLKNLAEDAASYKDSLIDVKIVRA